MDNEVRRTGKTGDVNPKTTKTNPNERNPNEVETKTSSIFSKHFKPKAKVF